jgi:hypothetical protein
MVIFPDLFSFLKCIVQLLLGTSYYFADYNKSTAGIYVKVKIMYTLLNKHLFLIVAYNFVRDVVLLDLLSFYYLKYLMDSRM